MQMINQGTPYVEPTDSSATVMRGVAAALAGGWMEPQRWPAHLVAMTGPANHLPVALRERLVRYFVRDVGISPDWAEHVTTAGLAQWAVDLYESAGIPEAPGDVLLIGAPSGGLGHLAALMDAPFLSQSFVTRYRYRGQPDDVVSYQAFGGRLAETILQRNPDLAVINHYDPLHDRFLIGSVNYIRMKLLDLPDAYADFIRRRLRPGGTILFADCRFGWGQYRVGRRHFFQVGGLGGVPDEEYIKGSDAVDDFLARHGRSGQTGWALNYPWLPGPESEWGTLPPFQQAVEAFAEDNGFRFRVLHGDHPEDFSRLAFYATYQALLKEGRTPAGVLVDCFTQTSPTAALQAGLLPLWLPFNCTDSLAFLNDMASNFPRAKPVLVAPVASYSPSWDVATLEQWQSALPRGAALTWIGVDAPAYPVDLAGLFRFLPDLQAWCAAHPQSRARLTVDDLEELIGSMAAQAAAGDTAE